MLLLLAYVILAVIVIRLREMHQKVLGLELQLLDEVRLRGMLQSDLDELRRGAFRTSAVVEEAVPAKPVEVTPEPPVQEPEAVLPPPLPVETPAVPMEPPAPKPEPPAFPAVSQGGLEQLIGGNLLNKVGALVLVIGIALFLSYSFANMGPAGRAFTGLSVSAAMLAAGVAFERRDTYRVFSRGVMAAGWAGLYFTSYALHALPATRVIESPAAGTAIMTIVAAGMVLHSLRYRVQSLTALSVGCVYAALGLSSLGTFTAIALIPLAGTALYMARRFEWQGLALLSAVATYTVFLTRPEANASLLSIQAMLLLFWLMFEGFDLLRGPRAAGPFSFALLGVNAVAGLGASAMVWNRMAPDSLWLFCAGAAALYLASTWIRHAAGEEETPEIQLTISAVLAGLAIFARVPGIWASIAFLVQAEVLYLASRRIRIRSAQFLSWIAFLMAARQIAEGWDSGRTAVLGFQIAHPAPPLAIMAGLFFWNRFLSSTQRYWSYAAVLPLLLVTGLQAPDRFLGLVWLAVSAVLFEAGVWNGLSEFRWQSYAVAALGVFAASWESAWGQGIGAVYFTVLAIRSVKNLASLHDWERQALRLGSVISGATLVLAVIASQLDGFWQPSAVVALSLAILEFGFWARSAAVRWVGRAVSALAGLVLLLQPPPVLWPRVGACAWLAASQFYLRFRQRADATSAAHAVAGALTVAGLLFDQVSGGMLTVSWSLAGIGMLGVGFALRDRWLRLPGLTLLLVCIGKVFFYDLRNLETMYRILSFIGLGLILLGVSWIYTRFREEIEKVL